MHKIIMLKAIVSGQIDVFMIISNFSFDFYACMSIYDNVLITLSV